MQTKITGTTRCFVAGTLVATRDGNKPIEEIEIGDEVWAYDEETGETGYKRVSKTFVNEGYIIIHITIDGETIDSTRPHPFYAPGEGFKQAGELVAGDQILLLDGSIKTIDKVTAEALETPVAVYNFTVEDWHTYFVGEQRVLVHNDICPVTNGKSIDNSIQNYNVNSSKKVYMNGNEGEAELKNMYGGKSHAYFPTTRGKRFVDQFADGIAHESKVGYTTLTKRVKEQILKDADLINSVC